jgi:hypothetical protein
MTKHHRLIDHDRHEAGLQSLARLHANGDITDPYVQAEYEIIKAQIAEEHSQSARSYFALLANKSNARRIVLACACQASTQM